ncbi:MAG: SPOR domain-containing protein [Gammaproteobacteria bacterium]|nr:SPOR domain-containing protein [Gammaproteobacteria bacterium]
MAISRFVFGTLLIGFILQGCSSRQPFQTVQSQPDAGWWQCDPKNEREWRCSDGQSVQETSDPIESIQVSQQPIETIETAEAIESAEPEVQAVETIVSESIAEDTVTEKPVVAQEPIQSLESAEGIVERPVESEEVVEVDEQISSQPEVVSTGEWIIQFAAFSSEAEALKFAERLSNTQIDPKEVNGKLWYRVILNGYNTKKAAQAAAFQLQTNNPSLQIWIRKRD